MNSQPGPFEVHATSAAQVCLFLVLLSQCLWGTDYLLSAPVLVCPAGVRGVLTQFSPSRLPQMRGHIPGATSEEIACRALCPTGGTTQTFCSPRYQSDQSPLSLVRKLLPPSAPSLITGHPDQMPVPSLGLSLLFCRA